MSSNFLACVLVAHAPPVRTTAATSGAKGISSALPPLTFGMATISSFFSTLASQKCANPLWSAAVTTALSSDFPRCCHNGGGGTTTPAGPLLPSRPSPAGLSEWREAYDNPEAFSPSEACWRVGGGSCDGDANTPFLQADSAAVERGFSCSSRPYTSLGD